MYYNKQKINNAAKNNFYKAWLLVKDMGSLTMKSEAKRFFVFKKAQAAYIKNSDIDNFAAYYLACLSNAAKTHQHNFGNAYCGITDVSWTAGARYFNQKWWYDPDYQVQSANENLLWQYSAS